MDLNKIGKFIAELRKEKNMTQQDLANKLHVTDRAVSHWENGRRLPDVSLFQSLCDILDISINELISGERISDDNMVKRSEENIINTLKDKKRNMSKAKQIIIVLCICLISLLIVYIIDVINMYPKIDLFNFTMQIADPEDPFAYNKLINKITIDKRNVYYFGIDFALFCDKKENCYQVDDALKHNQITLDEFQKYLEKQAEYENYKIYRYYDGGTTAYTKGGMMVAYCNTIEGNKDIYIGRKDMLDDLHGEWCGHQKDTNKNYTKTYKVLSVITNKKDNEFNDVVVEDINGKTGKALLQNSYDLVAGNTYYFVFITFDKFEETIDNIFANSILLDTRKLDENADKRDWINEDIYVNEDLDNGAELNELEHVRMDIIDGTLNRAGCKIKITDFSNNQYIYGESYRIDVYKDDKWVELPSICDNCAWNAMAYGPDKYGHLIMTMNWERLYGQLESGKYRIVKDVLKENEPCNENGCKKYYISVEFYIGDDTPWVGTVYSGKKGDN